MTLDARQMKLVAHLVDGTEVIGVWLERDDLGVVLAQLADGGWLGIDEEATGDTIYVPPHRLSCVRVMHRKPDASFTPKGPTE